jgi:hypothetical protein
VSLSDILFTKRRFEGARDAKTAFDFDTSIHQFAECQEFVARSSETQKSFKHIVWEIDGEETSKHGGTTGRQGSACPPYMKTFVWRLLARTSFANTLHAYCGCRQPILYKQPWTHGAAVSQSL